MSATKLAIVGVGKIVRDQHLPAIAGNPDFELICTASRHGTVDGVSSYGTIEAMLEAGKRQCGFAVHAAAISLRGSLRGAES